MDVFGIDLGGWIDSALGLFITVGLFLAIIGGVVVALIGGVLNNYRYKVILLMDRAGSYEVAIKKGRFLHKGKDQGKFEIRYGFMDNVSVEAPPEKFIYFGNWMIFYRKAIDDHRPCTLGMQPDGQLEFDPALQPAAKIAFGNQMEKNFLRFQEKDKWLQYSPTIALIVAAVIVGMAFIFGAGMVTEPWAQAAGAIQAQQATIANLIQNTTALSPIAGPYPVPPG